MRVEDKDGVSSWIRELINTSALCFIKCIRKQVGRIIQYDFERDLTCWKDGDLDALSRLIQNGPLQQAEGGMTAFVPLGCGFALSRHLKFRQKTPNENFILLPQRSILRQQYTKIIAIYVFRAESSLFSGKILGASSNMNNSNQSLVTPSAKLDASQSPGLLVVVDTA